MIRLPFPPASLSGHAKGNSHWGKSPVTKEWREIGHEAAKASDYTPASFAGTNCDIALHISLYPPAKRGDRTNMPNRLKPVFDGIADYLGVNDARFVPAYHFCPVDRKNPRVEIRMSVRPGIVWGEAA